ncbi:hypothetical protein OH492_03110 [Vibrio chagasii]|nr:hypothetical protein [Vibrio chagasii]
MVISPIVLILLVVPLPEPKVEATPGFYTSRCARDKYRWAERTANTGRTHQSRQ